MEESGGCSPKRTQSSALQNGRQTLDARLLSQTIPNHRTPACAGSIRPGAEYESPGGEPIDDMRNPNTDWLVQAPRMRATVSRRADGKEITLSNGLIRRVFRLAPNAATVALDNLMTGASMLRAVKPEASVVLDGVHYDI